MDAICNPWLHARSRRSSSFPGTGHLRARDRCPGDENLPSLSRQRRQPDQSGGLRTERLHSLPHGHRQICSMRSCNRQRPIARPRRPIASNGRRNRFRHRPFPAAFAEKNPPDRTCRCCRGSGRCFQRADICRCVCNRGGYRHLERRRAGRDRPRRGFKRCHHALVSRSGLAFSRSPDPTRASSRIAGVRRARRSGRPYFTAISEMDQLIPARACKSFLPGPAIFSRPSRD